MRAASMYTHLAAEYDHLLGTLAEVARLSLSAGVTVLDLGAGTGSDGRLLPTAVAGPYRIGVDASPAASPRPAAA